MDLFGGEDKAKAKAKAKAELFEDYDGFVEKFKPKKTTDDCYTPHAVYQVVLDYVAMHVDLRGKESSAPSFLAVIMKWRIMMTIPLLSTTRPSVYSLRLRDFT